MFRGQGLSDDGSEADPQKTGVPPLTVRALMPGTEKMARVANEFLAQARRILAGRPRANMTLLRGFSQAPTVPSMTERFKLRPAAIAAYPMYRGLAQIVGMKVLKTGATIMDEAATLAQHWSEHDYFYVHFKPADAAGEDGDFDKKVRALEEFDTVVPKVLALKPDVLMVAGDHSTPSIIGGHSWHPVPFLLHSPYSGREGVAEFSERACARGLLGRFPAQQAMLLALANARKLTKFGA
jgi:2,3-bisphosphoglycerate-independent phosphoglycerate mutase